MALDEKRKELNAKSKALAKVFEDAGSDMDLKKVKKFGDIDWSTLSIKAKTEEIQKANDELTRLGEEIDGLVALESAKDNARNFQKNIKSPVPHPAPEKKRESGIKTIGELMRENPIYQSWAKAREAGSKSPLRLDFDVYPSDVLAASRVKGMKTLMTTAAGWAPESTRIGRLIDEPTRPIEVLDIIPMNQTSQAAVVYMEETTRTHSAAEKAEGAAYAESAFVLTEQSSTVRKITDSIPVTDEQLDDVPQVEGYLNNRLLFGVRQRLDTQVLSGNGTAPNLEGILNASGIQTQALGVDPVPDAFYKAADLVRVTGRAMPNAIVMHANDWQAVRLLTSADGHYIWGSPSEAGPARMWGLPVVITTVSENTGLVGDFANYCGLFERKGVSIEVGYSGTQFVEGEKTLRAQMRAAFVTFRPAAFCTVTGI